MLRFRVGVAYFFFFNDTATTEIYTLSLHDALPIWGSGSSRSRRTRSRAARAAGSCTPRSEEHTSELQSHVNLVCRLLLEKKKNPLNADQPHLVSLLRIPARLRPAVKHYSYLDPRHS